MTFPLAVFVEKARAICTQAAANLIDTERPASEEQSSLNPALTAIRDRFLPGALQAVRR